MLWNSAAYIAEHRELSQGFYHGMFTLSERSIPAAECDATRWCPLV